MVNWLNFNKVCIYRVFWKVEVLCNVNREVVLYAGSVMVYSCIQLSSCAAYILFSAFNTGDEIDNKY